MTVAVLAVVAAGTASAMFVDYLADRALERSAGLARLAAITDAAARNEGVAQAGPAQPDPANGFVAADAAGAPPITVEARAASDPATDGEQIVASGDAAMDALPPDVHAPDTADGADSANADAQADVAPDETVTAAIPLPDLAPAPAPPPPELGRTPAVEAPAAAVEPAVPAAQPHSAKVTKAVKLRAGPTNKSGVLGVVPARSPVSVLNCKAWCQIVFEGKKGFVYKNFVRKS